MRASLLRAAVLGSMAGALLIPTAASAAETATAPIVYHNSGQAALLTFDIPDPSNPCLETSGFIDGGNFVTSSRGNPSTSGTFGMVWLARSNLCAWTVISSAMYKGPLPAGAFQIDKNLSVASLVATLDGQDGNGNPVAIEVNLAWTGVGDVFSGRQSSQYRSPGINAITHSSGDFRSALASGAISFDGSQLSLSAMGSLQSNRSFDLFVCRDDTSCK